jgi:hypothetical protein
VAWLDALLRARGISPDPGAALHEAMHASKDLGGWLGASRGDAAVDGRVLSRNLDFAFLARAIRRASSSQSFQELERMLGRLAVREEWEATKERSQTFELEVGSVFAGAGYKVKMAEPDV